MKIGIFYSIYSCDDIECSILYLSRMAYTIKYYNLNKLYENFDIIICTDSFTKKIMKGILHQENINDDKIIYRIYDRNTGSRGMFWRFESFFNIEYDICVNAEGDNQPDSFFKELQYFAENNIQPLLLNSVRRFSVNKNCFDGGRIFIRPNCICESLRIKLKGLLELFDNIYTIDYGVDERFIRMFIEKNMNNEKICFCIIPNKKIMDEIKDTEREVYDIKNKFKNAKFIYENYFSKNDVCTFFNKKLTAPLKLEYLQNIDGKQFYFYDKQFLRIKAPHRPRKSDFCQNRLLKLIDCII